MNPKRVITAALLVFVLASVVYLVATETRTSSTGTTGSTSQGGPQHHIIAYYFHGNVRCPTCRKIEAYAHEAIEAAFADELKTGKLQWQVINVEESGNDHFISDYELTTRSLVLSEMMGGTQRQWKNLGRVWDLVGDKSSFVQYVQDEVRTYLAESN